MKKARNPLSSAFRLVFVSGVDPTQDRNGSVVGCCQAVSDVRRRR
jgi:hypothetical protein